jgi:hypothetical protein
MIARLAARSLGRPIVHRAKRSVNDGNSEDTSSDRLPTETELPSLSDGRRPVLAGTPEWSEMVAT